jgi:heme oxygenase (biliverdin-producing, ferredoxin)
MSDLIVEQSPAVSVVTALYLRTKTLHLEAERTGVVRDILRGQASLESYVLFLRNLLPTYQELESSLDRHSQSPVLKELNTYRLDRTSAIESDLERLCGTAWAENVPLLPAGRSYAHRVSIAAAGDGTRLIAHAYTRYLGDLSGGLIMKRLLARSLALAPEQLSFYDFPQFDDLVILKKNYREALDRAGATASTPAAIVEEGATAFSLNIQLSREVQRSSRRQ